MLGSYCIIKHHWNIMSSRLYQNRWYFDADFMADSMNCSLTQSSLVKMLESVVVSFNEICLEIVVSSRVWSFAEFRCMRHTVCLGEIPCFHNSVWVRPPEDADFVISKAYSSEKLRRISKNWEVLARRNWTDISKLTIWRMTSLIPMC